MTLAVANSTNNPIKVMLVDDSAIIRGLYKRMLMEDPEIEVMSDAMNGEIAVDRFRKNPDIDVIILDIEMPVMDGLAAIPLLLEVNPKVMILMSSTLTARNAEYSLRAMQAGAADYLQKPTSQSELTTGVDFKQNLISKLKALGLAGRTKAARLEVASTVTRSAAIKDQAAPAGITLRKPGMIKPKLLAIGSSTGGPEALRKVFSTLKPEDIKVPVVITQHMPPTFTALLAEHIDKSTAWNCREGRDGDVLEPGMALVAPGDYHMVIQSVDGKPTVKLNQEPAENFCRPAVDPMLRSIAKAYGASVLTVILTGMGSDGMHGGKAIVEAGGTLVAQDVDTSVVWGMPGAVAEAGLCSSILPLENVSEYVTQFMSRFS